MKIQVFNGYTGGGAINVDDKRFQELTPEEQIEVAKSMLNILITKETVYSIVRELTETYGEYNDLGTCDQCGDWMMDYTLEI